MEWDSYLSFATHQKYVALARTVELLQVKEKRFLFSLMRTCPQSSHELFFPQYGFTAGAFCTWHILSDSKRPRRRKNDAKR